MPFRKKKKEEPKTPVEPHAPFDLAKHKLNGSVCEFCGTSVTCPVYGTSNQ